MLVGISTRENGRSFVFRSQEYTWLGLETVKTKQKAMKPHVPNIATRTVVYDFLLQANDLICHNTVVFSEGAGSLKVLPPLVDFIPEARLNLVSVMRFETQLQSKHVDSQTRASTCTTPLETLGRKGEPDARD